MFKHKKMRNQELMHDFKQHLAHAFEQGDYRTREELITKPCNLAARSTTFLSIMPCA